MQRAEHDKRSFAGEAQGASYAFTFAAGDLQGDLSETVRDGSQSLATLKTDLFYSERSLRKAFSSTNPLPSPKSETASKARRPVPSKPFCYILDEVCKIQQSRSRASSEW